MKKKKFEDFTLYSNRLTLVCSTLWPVAWKKNINKIITANLVIQTKRKLSTKTPSIFTYCSYDIFFLRFAWKIIVYIMLSLFIMILNWIWDCKISRKKLQIKNNHQLQFKISCFFWNFDSKFLCFLRNENYFRQKNENKL